MNYIKIDSFNRHWREHARSRASDLSKLKKVKSSVYFLCTYCCCSCLFCYYGILSVRNVLDIKTENPNCSGVNKMDYFFYSRKKDGGRYLLALSAKWSQSWHGWISCCLPRWLQYGYFGFSRNICIQQKNWVTWHLLQRKLRKL